MIVYTVEQSSMSDRQVTRVTIYDVHIAPWRKFDIMLVNKDQITYVVEITKEKCKKDHERNQIK